MDAQIQNALSAFELRVIFYFDLNSIYNLFFMPPLTVYVILMVYNY